MIPTRQVDREVHIADILLKSEAALSELHQYYKFERHEGTFPEKPYFLLSHSAHLLFSLWLTESESPTGLFGYSAQLENLVSNLDFDALRYTDYKRRALHGEEFQTHLKNEPKWFNFWLQALKTQDETRPPDCQAFSQAILGYVNHPGFLEGKIPRKNRKTLAGLMKTDAVARIFQRSMSLLEEMISAIVFRFSKLDQSKHSTEQLPALICLLRQVRRTIVTETPAQGPYILATSKSWGLPSALLRLYASGAPGHLKVVPKRDGGSIICAFHWSSETPSKRRSWTRDSSTLTHSYEEELFKTWSYETGAPLQYAEPATDVKAHWLVQSAESARLRALFRHVEMISTALTANPQCRGLATDIARVSLDNRRYWQDTALKWTYIQTLDQLLNKLSFAYREARVLGGDNPGQEVIANMWPSESPASEPIKSPEPSVVAPAPTSYAPTAEKHLKHEKPTGQIQADDRRPEDAKVQTQPSVSRESAAEERKSDAKAVDHDCEPTLEKSEPTPPTTSDRLEKKAVIRNQFQEHCQSEPSSDEQDDGPVPASVHSSSVTEHKSQDRQTATSDPRAVIAQMVSDRAFCQQIAQQPKREADAVPKPAETELAANTTSRTPPLDKQAATDNYQVYFERLAKQPVPTSVRPTANTRYRSRPSHSRSPRPKIKAEQMEAARQLLRQLLGHHVPDETRSCEDPLSLKALQCDLGWKQSEVQHTMECLFGRRPFTVYKHQCCQGTITEFLEECRHRYLSEVDAQHDMTPRPAMQTA